MEENKQIYGQFLTYKQLKEYEKKLLQDYYFQDNFQNINLEENMNKQNDKNQNQNNYKYEIRNQNETHYKKLLERNTFKNPKIYSDHQNKEKSKKNTQSKKFAKNKNQSIFQTYEQNIYQQITKNPEFLSTFEQQKSNIDEKLFQNMDNFVDQLQFQSMLEQQNDVCIQSNEFFEKSDKPNGFQWICKKCG
ncbi:hypothetical protein PPERSA_11776 [Pseudocohnilembus persalinus]|uniref:Uncharacterized protein n=1 Tax=Pseudocohnilembus persalinus TaxID=266149 RepID=A0A0V0QGD1_PSEPJ|nr:hypothetical protein PPERSA_11776 [Pseudocohnilembus persalinus]|eukprot:KRX01329.1 hypothetical protein PPERSA_11776 [Pseudocohnilembus persalinus]